MRKRWLLRLLPLVSLFAATPALADPPPAYARHVCPNGLEVLVVERHASPLVTVEIGVHNGAMTEPPEYNGLSHLYEHMFFKGNAVLPDQLAYLARVRELGMIFNGTTDTERVNYYFTTTSDHLADSMKFMHDAITSPLFDAKELDRERVVVTGEMDRAESTPGYYLEHETLKHSFWKYPSRKDPLGYRKTVLTATPAMMHTIQHRYYVPNNSVLVVTGDVKADDVFKQADALYVDWKKEPDPFVKFPVPAHPAIRKNEVVLIQQPVQTFQGFFNWHGPQTSDASVAYTYAADLLSAILDDPGSRFQRALVDSGKCARADLSYTTQAHTGAIDMWFESSESNADVCVRAVLDELPKAMSPDYFSDEEIANAAHRLELALARNRETTEDYAHLFTWFWTTSSLDYYAHDIDHVKATTRADLGKYLATYIVGQPYVLGAMESPDLAKGGKDKAHYESLLGIGAPVPAAKSAKGGAK